MFGKKKTKYIRSKIDSGHKLLRKVSKEGHNYVRETNKFVRKLYRWRFFRALAFDWRFRPMRVCRDPTGSGVTIREVSFDNCKEGYRVFYVPSGRLYTDRSTYIAVMTGNQLLPGASFQRLGPIAPDLLPEQSPAFGWGRIKRAPRRVQGSLVPLLPGPWGNQNYYHWLIGALPRIHLVEKAGFKMNDTSYLFPDEALSFQTETLDLLGISREARISCKATRHLVTDAIIATTYPSPDVINIPAWIVEWLRDAFLASSSRQSYSRLVYIGRRDAKKRRLINEQECFTTLLQPMGFEAYELTEMPFADQVSLFAGADAIVAIHGAALTNLVFCKKETSVVELLPANWQLRMFENISRMRQLRYHPIVCRDQQANAGWFDPDFTVRLDEMAATLQIVAGEIGLKQPRTCQGQLL